MAAKKDSGSHSLEPPSPGPETAQGRSMFLAMRYDTRMRYKSLSEDMEGSRTPTDKTMLFDYKDTLHRLDQYYRRVKRLILRFQSPTIGIFPQIGGEHTDVGWVRDSIYCGMSVWSLYQAYNRLDDDKGRIHELGQSAVKTMRGILFCWMRQADKVELFKQQQGPQFALHSKFHYKTGDIVADYNQYGHLQIDVVALFLLTLVQMISSGLQIIYTMDEASFIQNLVYYVERAYRTPDYGMWERGTRYNNGQCELHASSIGITKAALEAINGFNIFGSFGTSSSVIYVDIDAYNRNRTIFETLLPRESSSKNTDASLLPTMTFPCHAIHDEKLKHRTLDKAERKLRGKYGFRRFLRDGYKTVLEDTNRLHYDPGETKNFDAIESEWPMFDLFFLIDGIFKGDHSQVNFYQARVDDNVKISPEGDSMLPMYYYVQQMDIEDSRKNPQSVSRRSSKEWVDGKVHLWGNAMYIIACLLTDGLLHVNELDPIRRYLPASERPRKSIRYSFFQGDASDLIVQVVLIAESSRLQSILATYGIQSQTPHQIEPIQIWSAWELVKAYDYLGLNQKFGLSGRPPRPIGVLGTSKIYRICGKLVLCYPIMFEQSDFYLSHDLDLVIDDIKADIMFLAKFWKLSGRPTFCMVIRENDLRQGPHFAEMLKLLASFKHGSCDGVKIRTGRLQNLISMSCIEHLDFLQSMPEILANFKSFEEITPATGYKSLTDIPKAMRKASMYGLRIEDYENRSTWEICQQLKNCSSLRAQCGLLHILLKREGGSYYFEDGTVIDKIELVAKQAARVKHWQVVRFCFSILGKMVDSLVPSITSVLVRGKQVTIGIFGHKEQVIDKPITPTEMKEYIYALCQPYDICQAVLQQEIIISIGKLVSTKPELFDGILKIRIGWMIHAMKLELTYSRKEIGDTTKIEELSPSAVKQLLVKVLDKDLGHRSALQKRQLNGALNRVPDDFYDRVWEILERTPGGITVAERHLPQQPTLSDLTIYERSFSLKVENLLSRIVDPAYGQIIVEMFMVVSTILRRNPELKFPAALDMDKMVEEAFGYFKEDKKSESDSMESFLDTPPDIIHGTTSYLAKAAVNNLLLGEMVKGHTVDGNVACKMM